MDTDFEKWYENFLKEDLKQGEHSYLRLIPKDSKAGQLYVKQQKEFLKQAWLASAKAQRAHDQLSFTHIILQNAEDIEKANTTRLTAKNIF